MTGTALMTHVFVQLAVILGVCWVVWQILRRCGQTRVVADMVAGFVLGPSLFGLLLPDLQRALFPSTAQVPAPGGGPPVTVDHPSLTVLFAIGQIGLVLYMFLVGLGFDPKAMAGHVRHSVGISVTGVVVPLLAGIGIGWALAGDTTFFAGGISGWQAGLFVGAAMSVVAFPMLARIVHDSGLSGTRLGAMALGCAALDDVAAWLLLAVVVSSTTGDGRTVWIALGGMVLYVLLMVGPVRQVLLRLASRDTGAPGGGRDVLSATVLAVLLCAAFTDGIGIYSVFGAFLAGAVAPRTATVRAVHDRLEPVTTTILLPLFFVYSGLNTRLDLLIDPHVALVLVVVLVAAFVTKGGASFAACLAGGLGRWDSVSLSALLNARGLMELVLIEIGRRAGFVTPALYTVLAVMTVLTTVAASPLHAWAVRRRAGPGRVAAADAPSPSVPPGDDRGPQHRTEDQHS